MVRTPDHISPADYVDAIYGSSTAADVLRSRPFDRPDYLNRFARLLPALSLPLLRHLEQETPDVAVICERNAGPIGKAIEALIASSKNTKLETLPFRYYKISSRADLGATQRHLMPLLAEIHDEQYGQVTVIDDWMNEGATRDRFRQICRDFGVHTSTSWSTFLGDAGDFIAWPNSNRYELMPWREHAQIMGVDYDENLERSIVVTDIAAEFNASILEGARELGPILMRQTTTPLSGNE